jgi:hypothetical protein
MRTGRPRRIRIAKKARTRIFGHATKGARRPAQIRAAIKREAARKRKARYGRKKG